MAQRTVIERGFWSRLFGGKLRLENRPEVLKLIVTWRGREQVFDYHELRYAQAQGTVCLIALSDRTERYSFWWAQEQVAHFCAALNADLAEAYRQDCRPVLDQIVALRCHYVRDSEWEQCQKALVALRRYQADSRISGIDLYQDSGLSAEEIYFLEQVGELEDNASAVKAWLRRECEKYLLTQHADFLDHVEKYPLNEEQRQAVVRTNDRNLILAAAGTGKTSVIVAKALYLLHSGAAQPEDILIMAYNRAAAEEIKERLNACAERAGIDGSEVKASTFHALGRSVLVECNSPARVTVMATDEFAFGQWLDRWLFAYLKADPEHSAKFVELFLGSVVFDQVLKEHTFTSEHEASAKDVIAGNALAGKSTEAQAPVLQAPPELYRTLNNEKVKSRQEVYIANWLATNGIPYKYEDRYFTKARVVPGFDYKPDFHIIRPRTDSQPGDDIPIYLEHYGIDREGHTKPGIDQQAYNDLIARKRKLHQENGTILLETFSYHFAEKTIDAVLEEHMKAVGIPLRPCSPEELLQKIQSNKGFSELRELFQRCLQIIREFNYSYEDLLQRYEAAGMIYAQAYAEFFAQLASDYQAQLDRQGEIDFCDMILQATELIADGSFKGSWRYILVDEFQDISLTRLKLLQQLIKRDPKCVLTCVGDDWQAIYHFAGGILDATINFEHYFGSYTQTALVQTYRYPQSIAATAGTFIQENPQQFKKNVVSLQPDTGVKVHLIDAVELEAYTIAQAFCLQLRELNFVHSAITSAIAALVQALRILYSYPDANIAIISRYNKILEGIAGYLERPASFPANMLYRAHQERDNFNLSSQVWGAIHHLFLKPDVAAAAREQIKLWSMHKSKGLEADYVILAGLFGGQYLSFPCHIKDSELLEALLDKQEGFEDAEERRLFYVTMTRAKREAYLICDTSLPISSFAAELLNPKYQIDIQVKTYQEEYLRQYGCKICNSGIYTLVQGQYGPYYVCSNPACHCKPRVCELCGAPSVDHQGFSECTNPQCGVRIPLCERCGRPMRLREGRFGKFYGCSGYGLRNDTCTFTKNYEAMQRLLNRKSNGNSSNQRSMPAA